MLRSMKELEDYTLGATDGPLGTIKDFYFDDDAWVIRYLIVETGSWLASRKVLISPISIRKADGAERLIEVSLTKEQVEKSPDIDTDKPVSRQHEVEYLGYYGYPGYWGGVGMWGEGLYPYAMMPGYPGFGTDQPERDREIAEYASANRARHRNDDPHLRSCRAVVGYHIHASDGEIGHVQGMLVDEETWAIRYLVIDTTNWFGGHKVLVSPQWVTGVHWSNETVSLDLSRQAIKDAPPYDPSVQLDRQGERSLHSHYGRSGYWAGGVHLETEM